MTLGNPWLRTAYPARAENSLFEPDGEDAAGIVLAPEAPTGPLMPQPHVAMPKECLPVRRVTDAAGLWLVGAHGGAGETTIAALDPAWRPAGHAWPETTTGAPAICVVLARTHVQGLLAAQRALTQWAARGAGDCVHLAGLLLIPDAPGRLPARLRDLVTLVSGGAPRTWEMPWVEEWRFASPGETTMPRAVAGLVRTLRNATHPPLARS